MEPEESDNNIINQKKVEQSKEKPDARHAFLRELGSPYVTHTGGHNWILGDEIRVLGTKPPGAIGTQYHDPIWGDYWEGYEL